MVRKGKLNYVQRKAISMVINHLAAVLYLCKCWWHRIKNIKIIWRPGRKSNDNGKKLKEYFMF